MTKSSSLQELDPFLFVKLKVDRGDGQNDYYGTKFLQRGHKIIIYIHKYVLKKTALWNALLEKHFFMSQQCGELIQK